MTVEACGPVIGHVTIKSSFILSRDASFMLYVKNVKGRS